MYKDTLWPNKAVTQNNFTITFEALKIISQSLVNVFFLNNSKFSVKI